jgi:hypothetical protein
VPFDPSDQAIGLPNFDGGMIFEQVVGVLEGLGVVAETAVDRAADVALAAKMVESVGLVVHRAVPPHYPPLAGGFLDSAPGFGQRQVLAALTREKSYFVGQIPARQPMAAAPA